MRLAHLVGGLVVTAAFVGSALAGCGSGSSSALKNPGTQGVEALREEIRSALEAHDTKKQCELFAPALVREYGETIAACAAKVKEGNYPYPKNPKAFVAGGAIELSGNQAVYQRPSGTSKLFAAVYAEGSWKVVPDGE
jgi:hypothetical protein